MVCARDPDDFLERVERIMNVVVFDVRGPYALFRKPYAVMSPVSYPVPPPTAVFGLVGAIAGFDKREYLSRIGEREVRVGIRLLRPVQKFRAGLNFIDTRVAGYFLKRPGPGVKGLAHIQVPHEFLKDVAYRIYFTHTDPDVVGPLVERLESGRPAYTPCLGLAQCLADVSFRGLFVLEARGPAQGVMIHSTVPLGEGVVVRYDQSGRYVRYRVASRMTPEREVTRYDEIVVETQGRPIVADVPGYFEVNGENVLFQ